MEVEWIDCQVRLPDLHQGLKLIAYVSEFGVKCRSIATWVGDKWIIELGKRHGITEYVTHWMDLPTPESVPSTIYEYYCAKCIRAIFSGTNNLKRKCSTCKQNMSIQD